MKFILVIFVCSVFVYANETTSKKQKLKDGINKAADTIDAGTREVIGKSKKALKKQKAAH